MTSNLINKYSIFCNTDNRNEYSWSLTPLSQCPINVTHSVNVNSVREVTTDIYSILTGPSTVSARAEFMLCNTTSGNINIILPNPTLGVTGIFKFMKTSVNNIVNILPSGSNLIDGTSFITLTNNNQIITLGPTGSNWKSIGVTATEYTENINLNRYLRNQSTLNYLFKVPSDKYLVRPTGITGSLQLFSGGNETIPYYGLTGTNDIAFNNNDLTLSNVTDDFIIIDKSINLSGETLTIQAGGVAINSPNENSGNLILRSGIATGYGGTTIIGSTGINQQKNLIVTQVPVLGITGSINDAIFMTTKIIVPPRNFIGSVNYDIVKINFIPNTNTAISFNIFLFVSQSTSADSKVMSTSRAVVVRQSSANVITSSPVSIFTDVRIPSTTGTRLTPTWTITNLTNAVTIDLTVTQALIAPLTFSSFSYIIDNILYNPNHTTITVPSA
jgi:hypothetical protein